MWRSCCEVTRSAPCSEVFKAVGRLSGARLPCGEVTRIYRLEPSGEYILISIRLSDVCHDDIYIYIFVWPDRFLFLYSLVLKKKLFTENIYVDLIS